MGETFGPFDGGAGATLGEDFYFDTLGPMLRGDGVDGDPLSTALQVYADSSGMQVKLRAGRALVRATGYSLTGADYLLAISANAAASYRVDRVVLRHDRTNNTLGPVVLEGAPGGAWPALAAGNGLYDLPLGRVRVDPGVASIAASAVVDDRRFLPLNRVVCYSSTRPSNPKIGQVIYEQDTGLERRWSGQAWDLYPSDTGWLPVSAAGAWDVSNAFARRIGREVYVTGDIKRTGPTVPAGRQAATMFNLPASCRPGVPQQHTYGGFLVQTQREWAQLTVQTNGALQLYYNPVDITNGATLEVATSFPAA